MQFHALTKVLFICRGSARDGMGHVNRSRSVASVMQQQAAVHVVVIGDEYVDNLLAGRDIPYTVVDDAAQAMRHFETCRPDIVIFDLLNFPEADFRAIRSTAMVASLSPIFNHLSEVDLIFHRTSVLGDDWSLFTDKPVIKSGLEYAVIGEHCRKIPEHFYRQCLVSDQLSVAISMGGSDATNKTLRVLETVKASREKLLIWVLLGEGYAHSYQLLVDCVRGSIHEVILAKTNDSMWRILSMCALAVLAGGTTTYEAAYAGLPSVNLLESPRQFFLIKELVDRGMCMCAGQSFDASLNNLTSLIAQLNNDREQLHAMHLNCQDVMDGLGVYRIIDAIWEYYHSHYPLKSP